MKHAGRFLLSLGLALTFSAGCAVGPGDTGYGKVPGEIPGAEPGEPGSTWTILLVANFNGYSKAKITWQAGSRRSDPKREVTRSDLYEKFKVNPWLIGKPDGEPNPFNISVFVEGLEPTALVQYRRMDCQVFVEWTEHRIIHEYKELANVEQGVDRKTTRVLCGTAFARVPSPIPKHPPQKKKLGDK